MPAPMPRPYVFCNRDKHPYRISTPDRAEVDGASRPEDHPPLRPRLTRRGNGSLLWREKKEDRAEATQRNPLSFSDLQLWRERVGIEPT